MKLKIVTDPEREEEVIIYAHQKNELVKAIERLVLGEEFELIGYKDMEAVRLSPSDVYCFVVEENKVYALTQSEKLQLKCRLYHLDDKLPENFVKINQSCIANIKMIDRFDASFSGSLTVIFKNGYIDYVSRRNLKSVKERLVYVYE